MSRILKAILLNGVLATGAGSIQKPQKKDKLFQLTGFVSASTGSAVVVVEGTLDGVNFVTIDTLTLTLGTAITSDSGADSDPWITVRGRVTTLTGTDAEVTLTMSSEE